VDGEEGGYAVKPSVCPACGCAIDRIPVHPDERRQAMVERTRASKAANDSLLADLRKPSRFAVSLGDIR
jgi:hypothetical protein